MEPTHIFGFADGEELKKRLRQAYDAETPAYDVRTKYDDTGFFQFIAKHDRFEITTLSVIVLNAVWIWIDTDWNKSETLLDAHPVFIAADVIFFSYFFLELFIRFNAFKRKIDCCFDHWFVFDTLLVILYAFDPFVIACIVYLQDGSSFALPTASFQIFRLAKLARLFRLVRMLRSFPELLILIKGMAAAMKSVGYILALLSIVTYVFAVALVSLAEPGTVMAAELFPDVPNTMHRLLMHGTLMDDLSGFILLVQEDSIPCLLLCWLYIALGSLMVMNMLIGVLCEVISSVAISEKEGIQLHRFHETVDPLINALDSSNGGLNWTDFKQLVGQPEALNAFRTVGIEIGSVIDCCQDLFFDHGKEITVPFGEFKDMVLDLRSSQQATIKDIFRLQKAMNSKFFSLKTRMDAFEKALKEFLQRQLGTGGDDQAMLKPCKWQERQPSEAEKLAEGLMNSFSRVTPDEGWLEKLSCTR